MRISLPVLAACLFSFSAAAFGQPVSFGVVGGASLTEDFQNQILYHFSGEDNLFSYSTPKRWIAGGMIEVRLPLHLSVEADGLYHELGFTTALIEPNGTFNSISPATVVTWEFPVMVKYRFSLPLVKPFVEAGPSFRKSGNLNGTVPSNHGFTAGVGVEAHAWKLKIAAQVRDLRWAADRYERVGILSASPFTVRDQAEFLVSVSY